MEQIFIDINGRQIRFTKERIAHIIQSHPEVASCFELIKNTIENPEFIFQSNSDESVELFYHYYLATPVGDKWLCVLVKMVESDFFIITVYFTNKIKKGELKWKRK